MEHVRTLMKLWPMERHSLTRPRIKLWCLETPCQHNGSTNGRAKAESSWFARPNYFLFWSANGLGWPFSKRDQCFGSLTTCCDNQILFSSAWQLRDACDQLQIRCRTSISSLVQSSTVPVESWRRSISFAVWRPWTPRLFEVRTSLWLHDRWNGEEGVRCEGILRKTKSVAESPITWKKKVKNQSVECLHSCCIVVMFLF